MTKDLALSKTLKKSMALPPLAGKFEDRRQFPRATTVIRGQLQFDGQKVNGVVLDVSVNGVKIKLEEELSIGTDVKLAFAGSVFFGGQIAWCQGDTVGVRFEKQPEKVAQIMAAFLPLGCLEHLGTA